MDFLKAIGAVRISLVHKCLVMGLLMGLGGQPAGATVMRPAPASELAHQADAVIHGRVIERWVVPKRGPKGEIYTRTTVEVMEYFRGTGPRFHTIQQLGGVLDGFHMTVEGSPDLRVQDEVVLFLSVDHGRALSFVVGLAQGVYYVENEGTRPWVYQDLSGLSFYTRVPQRVRRKMGGLEFSLAQLRRQVQGLRVFSTVGRTPLKVRP